MEKSKHLYRHVFTHKHTHTTHAFSCAYVHTWMHAHIYTHPHPSMYTHTYKHTTHACSCAHMHTWIHGHVHTHTHTHTLCMHIHAHMDACTYDLVPKGVQEKRTEVLENKVDRMWVSNAVFEWTREVIHQWREKAVLLFIPEKFDFQCDLWQNVEHYTLQQAHITVLLIMQLTAKTQLILQDHLRCAPHEYYQVNCCCSVSHRTACYA